MGEAGRGLGAVNMVGQGVKRVGWGVNRDIDEV